MRPWLSAIVRKEASVKISVGAITGQWSRSAAMAFYDAVALSSANIVYLGVTNHTPHATLQRRDCLAVARELAADGKEVVLSARTAGDVRDAESFRAWIEECGLPVEADDATTLRLLSGRAQLVIGPGVPCENGTALKQLMELGARRWVIPAVCKGEVMQALSYGGNAGCEIELPVLSHRKFSRWRCRVDACPYEDWPRHAMPGCDLDASPEHVAPDWACDIATLRAAGVAILRVTPRHVRDVALSQTLSELVRGEIDAQEAYAQYAAGLDTRVRAAAARHPCRPEAVCQAGAGFR